MRAQEYYNFIERTNEGMIIVQDTLLRFVNQRMADMTGYTVSEVLNTPFINYIHPDELSKVFNRYERRMSGENIPSAYETEIMHRKGHKIPVRINASLAPYKGKPANFVIVHDIIEYKKAEEALKESEEKYKHLVNSLPQTVFELDERGNFTFANQQGFKSTGYTQEDLNKELNALQLFVPEDRERVIKNIMRILKGEGSGGNEYTAIRKDGSRFPVIIYSSPIVRNEKLVGLRGIVVDITKQKQAEEALRESEEKYRLLFENAYDAIFIADTKTHIVIDANRQTEILIGRPRKEIIGMHQSKLYPPEYEEYYMDKYQEYVQKGAVIDAKAEIIRKDGSIVPVSIRASVVRLQGKDVIQGLFTDISKEKRILKLKEEIETKRFVDKAKRILMERHKISDKEAASLLQKESRRQRKKIKEVAEAVISSESMF
ncbi:MAG: PAS domain S-box protein [Thermodesulfobacteriota bacterium]|nr:PAS domain S-box protein [Thermodesulfobacteriota bacterium]